LSGIFANGLVGVRPYYFRYIAMAEVQTAFEVGQIINQSAIKEPIRTRFRDPNKDRPHCDEQDVVLLGGLEGTLDITNKERMRIIKLWEPGKDPNFFPDET